MLEYCLVRCNSVVVFLTVGILSNRVKYGILNEFLFFSYWSVAHGLPENSGSFVW